MTNRGVWLPVGLAVLVTGLNAAKPVVVDDTAYLLLARHISQHPADPYGFDLFWYAKPQPAWQILLPPVVPYWLGLGTRLFGDHLGLLKLWLFPFVLVLAVALSSLLRRLARGYDRPMLAATMLGPAVLPLVNVMLDVPAAALGLAAVALFARGCDRSRLGWVVAAGLTAGLAIQTKYTALTVPVVLALYGFTHRRPVYAVVAGVVALALFVGWETFIARQYGESHFLYHLRDQSESTEADDVRGKLLAVWEEKRELFQPMLGYLGWLGLGVGMVATAAVGAPRWWLVTASVISAAGLTAVCVVPARYSVLVPDKLDFSTLACVTLGSASGLATLAAVKVLAFRRLFGIRRRPDVWFLALWLGLELSGYFALTPFPAGRRVLMLTLVGGLVAARLLSRMMRLGRPPGWLPAVGVTAGVGLFAVDTWDAYPEKVLAERAAAACRPGRAWFSGHWGFQYYCDRAGMTLVSPWRPDTPTASTLRAGDFLVLPVLPDAEGFYRPYHGQANFDLEASDVELMDEFVWDDWLPAQTVPTLYGGKVPVKPRAHPRLRVAVYRVARDWTPIHTIAP